MEEYTALYHLFSTFLTVIVSTEFCYILRNIKLVYYKYNPHFIHPVILVVFAHKYVTYYY